MSLHEYQQAERFARTIASAIERGDIEHATGRLTDIAATDQLYALRVVEAYTGTLNSDTRPVPGEMDALNCAIKGATGFGSRPYNPEDVDFNRALVNAVSGMFLRQLQHDDLAKVDVAAHVGPGEHVSQQQRTNQQRIFGSPTHAILNTVIHELRPQHCYDVADNLLNWGEQHKGSIPLYWTQVLECACDTAHRLLRQKEIDALVTEATALGKVRPAHSPRRAIEIEAKAKAGG